MSSPLEIPRDFQRLTVHTGLGTTVPGIEQFSVR
jgi:hypothetical protein